MAKRHGLGRGLGALIKDGTAAKDTADHSGMVLRAPLDRIAKNPWQPRKSFQKESLDDLTRSVKEHGVLQPLLVRATNSGYELIAGERRLRAAAEAGLKDVPVIVMEAGDMGSVELALIENLQREDLNPLEEAEGYRVLAEKFNLTQEAIAERVGKARASVANALRLLSLPAEIKRLLSVGGLTAGHAKALSALEITEEQVRMAQRTVKENLSVRNLEKLVQRARLAPRKPRVSRDDIPPPHVTDLADRLHTHFGTSVRVSSCKTYANGKKGKGSIDIEFYSNEELDRILQLIGLTLE